MSKQKFMFVTNATFLSKYLLPLTVLNEGTFFLIIYTYYYLSRLISCRQKCMISLCNIIKQREN